MGEFERSFQELYDLERIYEDMTEAFRSAWRKLPETALMNHLYHDVKVFFHPQGISVHLLEIRGQDCAYLAVVYDKQGVCWYCVIPALPTDEQLKALAENWEHLFWRKVKVK